MNPSVVVDGTPLDGDGSFDVVQKQHYSSDDDSDGCKHVDSLNARITAYHQTRQKSTRYHLERTEKNEAASLRTFHRMRSSSAGWLFKILKASAIK